LPISALTMRFKLTLSLTNSFGKKLPLNYQYEQSAAIYRILAQANEEYTIWLHENGYKLASGKSFKLFSYSRFEVERYRILKQTAELEILSDNVVWYISFLPEKSTEQFIVGIFNNQQFEVGTRKSNVRFQVQSVELMPPPIFSEKMSYETLSPICLALRQLEGYDKYIAPNHSEATRLIKQNLLDKYLALTGNEFSSDEFPFAVEILNEPKSNLIHIKSGTPQASKVRGFMCNIRLTAPVELQKIAYETGIGSKNSIGFGMVREVNG